jgi:hypothetical protein
MVFGILSGKFFLEFFLVGVIVSYVEIKRGEEDAFFSEAI